MSRSMSSGMMPTAMLSRTGGTSLAAPQASTLPSSLSGPGVGGEAVNVGAARVAAERPSWEEVLRAVAVVVPHLRKERCIRMLVLRQLPHEGGH